MRPRTYVGLVVIAAVFSAIGFWRDGWAFSSNLFAEATGIFVSIAIGFALVDHLIEREARRKWARVSEFTLTLIRHYIDDIEFACITTPGLMGHEAARPRPNQMTPRERLHIFACYIANNAEEIVARFLDQEVEVDSRFGRASMSIPDPSGRTRHITGTQEDAKRMREEWLDEASTAIFYRQVQPVFERLRTTITPRVLEFGYEPQLVGALVAVEVADRSWHSALQTIEDDWGLPEHYAWQEAASALEACAQLAELVDELQGSASHE